MFQLFKHHKKQVTQQLHAVVDGEFIPITSVHDEIFSNKIMGDGFAIIPSDQRIVSPASGVISTVFPTKHAIALTLDNGLDLLIHLGIDTVELDGVPFENFVHVGDYIEAGTQIATMDIDYIKEHGKATDCVVVCTNSDAVEQLVFHHQTTVEANDVIGEIRNK